jgi:hypothetical protein
VIAAGFDRGSRSSPFSFESPDRIDTGAEDADEGGEATDDMEIPGFVQG